MIYKRRDSKGRILKDHEYQRNDGKYEYKFKDIDGVRKSVYSWRLVETDPTPPGKRKEIPLREKEVKIWKKLSDKLMAGSSKTSLNDMFGIYMKTKVFSCATEENYNYMWRKFIQDSIGQKKVADLKKSDITRFYAQQKRNGLADGTIQIFQKMIHPSLQLAVDDDLIRKNPADGCCRNYMGSSKRKPILSETETEIFFSYLRKSVVGRRYELLFRVMLGTSCRIGEIVGLTWKNVDMDKRMITIDHTILYRQRNGKAQFYAKSPKTEQGIRVIPMTDDVYACFKKLEEAHPYCVSTVVVDGYTDFVFTSLKGKPLYPASINKFLYRTIEKMNENKRVEMPKISNHSFRHTGCTRMVEAGMDINTIRYVMGHENTKMIMKVYDHINIERVQKQMEKLSPKDD